MPTKHINDTTWRLVEKETVRAVLETREPVKDTDVLNWLILRGLKDIDKADYKELKKDDKK
ncbi:hypothetical protein [Shewanella sp.]|uniref:hypothetical protein n=1 Tax=Shewanella sp. TaxID=50422 RepID=UPI003A86E043